MKFFSRFFRKPTPPPPPVPATGRAPPLGIQPENVRLYGDGMVLVTEADGIDFDRAVLDRPWPPGSIGAERGHKNLHMTMQRAHVWLLRLPDFEPDVYKIRKNRYDASIFENLGIEITPRSYDNVNVVIPECELMKFGFVRMSEGDIVALALSL